MSFLDPTPTREEKQAENSRPQFNPSSYLECQLFINDSGQAAQFKDEPFTRPDGSKALPIQVTLVCINDADGANEIGARHQDSYFLDLNEEEDPDMEHSATKARVGILGSIARRAFSKENYPTDDDGNKYRSWIALREHGALATETLAYEITPNGDYVKLKATSVQ